MKKHAVTLVFIALVAGSLAAMYFFLPATAEYAVRSGASTAGAEEIALVDESVNADASASVPAADILNDDSVDDTGGDIGGGSLAILPRRPSLNITAQSSTVANAPDATTTASATTTAPIITTVVESAPPSSSPQCTASAATAASSTDPSLDVVINEIAWMGSPASAGETGQQAGNREWIELKNNSAVRADISGWHVLDSAGNIKISIGDDVYIPAHGFFLLARGSSTLIQADTSYSGILSNAGDDLYLLNAQCGLADRILAADGWSGGDNGTKRTLERDADGADWHTSAYPGGTPRAGNSIPVAQAAPTSTAPLCATSTEPVVVPPVITPTSTAPTSTVPTSTISLAPDHLVITEVSIAGSSSTNDFVKIFNPTDVAVDAAGWKLRKKSKSGADYSLRVFPDGTTIAPGGYFLWANGVGGFGDGVGADVTSTETLAADNSVALFDKDGMAVDAVAWGEGSAQYGETAAYPTNPEPGQVLKRKWADGVVRDTDNNADDFTI